MDWYHPDWPMRVPITASASRVPSTQNDIPLLFAVTVPAFAGVAQSGGEDFVVTAADGTTVLPHDRRSYVTGTGELVLFFEADVLNGSSNTTFCIYFGNASVADQNQRNATWANDYEAVYHFDEATGGPWIDATGNGNDLVSSGGTPSLTTDPADKMWSHSLLINAAGEFIADVVPPTTPIFTINTVSGSGVMEIFFQPSNADTSSREAINGAFGPRLRTNTCDLFTFFDSGAEFWSGKSFALINGEEHYIVNRYDQGAATHYFYAANDSNAFAEIDTDGVGGAPSILSTATNLWVPNRDSHLQGIYRELRISNVDRSADFLEATYLNLQEYASYWTVGAVEFQKEIPVSAFVSGLQSGSTVAVVRKRGKAQSQYTCPANVASSLNGTFWDFDTPRRGYRPWYSTLGSGTPPAAGGRTLLNIDLSNASLTSEQVASESQAVLATVHEVAAVVGGAREAFTADMPLDTAGDKAGTYWTFYQTDRSGGEVQIVVWYFVDQNGTDPRGLPEISVVQTVDDVSGSLGGTYWTFTAQDTTDANYYVWFNTGASTDPAPGGTGIEVAISADDLAETVAIAMVAALQAEATSSGLFTVSRAGDTASLVNKNKGAVTAAADGTAPDDTGFSISQSQQGLDPAVAGLDDPAVLGVRVDLVGGSTAITNAAETAAALNAAENVEATVTINAAQLDQIQWTAEYGGAVTSAADGGGGRGHGASPITITTQGTSDAVEFTNREGGDVTDTSDGDAGGTATMLAQGDDVSATLAQLDSSTLAVEELVYLTGATPRRGQIQVWKPGSVPIFEEVVLSQAGVSVPVGSRYQEDRIHNADALPNFTDGTEVVFTVDSGVEDLIGLVATGNLDSVDGVTQRDLVKWVFDLWRTSPTRKQLDYPFTHVDPEQVVINFPWAYGVGVPLYRDAGSTLVNLLGGVRATYAGIRTEGDQGTDQQYFLQQSEAGTPVDFTLRGTVNELVQVFGDADHGAMDYTTFLGVYARRYGRKYAHRLLKDVGFTTLGGQLYRLQVDTENDPANNTAARTMSYDQGADGGGVFIGVGDLIEHDSNANRKAVVTAITVNGSSPTRNGTIEYVLRGSEDFQDNDPFTVSATGASAVTDGAPTLVVAGYTGITFTFGHQDFDLNNGNGLRPYALEIGRGGNTDAQIYEYCKWICDKNSSTTLLGSPGSVYRGVGEITIPYDAETSPFTEGATLTGGTSGATGVITAVDDDGTTGNLCVRSVLGTFLDNETITDDNGTPGSATANIPSGAIRLRTTAEAPLVRWESGRLVGQPGVFISGASRLTDMLGVEQIPPQTVNLTVTVRDITASPIENAQVAIYDSNDVELLNTDTNASGIAATTYIYSADEPVTVRVRKSSPGDTRYEFITRPSTIEVTGLSEFVTLEEDPNVT